MFPSMATTPITSGRRRRTLPQIGRVRRGWVFRDDCGAGWWLDDTVVAAGTHRVVVPGDPSAHCRVFTPMVGARCTARRIYRFDPTDDHSVLLAVVTTQYARALEDEG
jgi:hypothetical protein